MGDALQRNTDFFGYKWVELFPGHGWRERRNTLWSDSDFIKWFDLEPDLFKDKIVLDAGCGNGYWTKKILDFGAGEVVGIDISNSVEVAKKYLESDPRVKIINGDLNELPPNYKEYFDIVFSSGVIHHTPDPRRSFSSLVSYAKPGSLLAVWVYEKGNPLRQCLNFFLRRMTRRLAKRDLLRFCYFLLYLKKMPVTGKLLSAFIKIHNELHGLVDWYGCWYQYHLSEREIRLWCKEEGIAVKKVVPNPHQLEIKNKAVLLISQLIYGKNLGWMGVIGMKNERDKNGRP